MPSECKTPGKTTPVQHAHTCDLKGLALPEHGVYCLHEVGRPIQARDEFSDPAEITVYVASRIQLPPVTDTGRARTVAHHTDVVQFRITLPGGDGLILDLQPGEFRRLLAAGHRAADVTDWIEAPR